MDAPSVPTLLKARLATVRSSLSDVIERLSDDLLEWAPSEGMRTVRDQLFEIVGKEVEFLAFAKERGDNEWVEIDAFGDRENSISGWVQILSEVRRDTLAYLDSLSDEDLDAIVRFPEQDWWEGLCLPAIPMHEVFRGIAAHEWYHTGQLVSYLLFRGDYGHDG